MFETMPFMPEQAAAHAADVDRIIVLLHWIMGLLFVGWMAFFVFCLVRFRAGRNPTADYVGSKSKIVAGLLGILLPGLGLQRFYLGYIGTGILQILTAPCGVGVVWGFVEGIVCLCGGMRDVDGYELHD